MLKTSRSSILWAGACVAILVAASQSARALDADDDCNGSEGQMMMAAAAVMRSSPIESPLDASRRWLQGREADAWYREARTADREFRDGDAVSAYRAVLQIEPRHVEALHRLAYLQATSDDPTARNQVEALVNSERALEIVLSMMVGRRGMSPDSMHNLAVLRVGVLNSLAAVAASGGNYTKAAGLVETAINKARSMADADPQDRNHLAVVRLQNNLAALQARQPLRGVRQIQ
jgi:hypothetical protein